MTFLCIADAASSAGFRLAGVETVEVSGREDASRALKEFARRRDAGVILVTGSLCRLLSDEIAALRRERDLPIVLEVPSATGESGAASIGEFVRQALGVSI